MIWVLIVIAILLFWLVGAVVQLNNNVAKWIEADVRLRKAGK